MAQQRSFVPAAGHDWLLPFYDPLQRLLGGDSARQQLLEQAAIRPGQRILDIGCGTGSLLVLIRAQHPETEVVGLDPDPKALARARRKLEGAGLSAELRQGFSDELPFSDASFDRLFSSFMFHHLGRDEKHKTLQEARRVLAPAGSLHLLDFAGSEGRHDGFLARLLHSSEHLGDNTEARIPAMMREAGWADPSEVAHRTTFFGRIGFFIASSPASR